MKNKFSIVCVCLMALFSIFICSACGLNSEKINETEKNWLNKGAWSEIYVYKGEGELLDMQWSDNEQSGIATINNTNATYTLQYIALYENDSNYIRTDANMPSGYTGNVKAFETLDGRLWVRIMWSKTTTFILVNINE